MGSALCRRTRVPMGEETEKKEPKKKGHDIQEKWKALLSQKWTIRFLVNRGGEDLDSNFPVDFPDLDSTSLNFASSNFTSPDSASPYNLGSTSSTGRGLKTWDTKDQNNEKEIVTWLRETPTLQSFYPITLLQQKKWWSGLSLQASHPLRDRGRRVDLSVLPLHASINKRKWGNTSFATLLHRGPVQPTVPKL